jgi:hypothetical protein
LVDALDPTSPFDGALSMFRHKFWRDHADLRNPAEDQVRHSAAADFLAAKLIGPGLLPSYFDKVTLLDGRER